MRLKGHAHLKTERANALKGTLNPFFWLIFSLFIYYTYFFILFFIFQNVSPKFRTGQKISFWRPDRNRSENKLTTMERKQFLFFFFSHFRKHMQKFNDTETDEFFPKFPQPFPHLWQTYWTSWLLMELFLQVGEQDSSSTKLVEYLFIPYFGPQIHGTICYIWNMEDLKS